MVYQVESTRGGLKLVDDLNFIYRINRKYGPKTYWKCENADCKARLHTVLENDNLSVCKTFGEHCHPSNPSKPKICRAKAILKAQATTSQASARSLIAEMSSTLDDNAFFATDFSAHVTQH